jgi:hypothetical protein
VHHAKSLAKSIVRLRPRVASAATSAAFAVVAIGAPAAASAADPPRVDINQISIVGTPKLFIAQPGSTGSAFVVFQTRPRLRTVRQVVVEIKGKLGRSYTSRGRARCVRSTFLHVQTLKAGSGYRVRFYARSGRAGKIEKLITTRTLTARKFAGRPAALPDCLT